MQTVRIYKPSKQATQSGKSKTHRWIMSYVEQPQQYRDSLVGWTGTHSTLHEVSLYFDSLVEAEQYAEAQGFNVIIDMPHERAMTIKSYADNFKFDRLH